MDTENSVVIARRKSGWVELEESIQGLNGDRKK